MRYTCPSCHRDYDNHDFQCPRHPRNEERAYISLIVLTMVAMLAIIVGRVAHIIIRLAGDGK